MKCPISARRLFPALLAGLLPVFLSAQIFFRDAYPGLQATATGTGRTTGHIADLTLYNTTSSPIQTTIGPLLIPSDGEFQGYVVNGTYPVVIPAFRHAMVSLHGYCTDIAKLALPEGSPASDVSAWVVAVRPLSMPGPGSSMAALGYEEVPAQGGETAVLSYPGTNIPFPYRLDVEKNAKTAAGLLAGVVTLIEESYERWRENGEAAGIFEYMPENEHKNTIVQHVFWYYTSALQGKPYPKSFLTGAVIRETEKAANTTAGHYTPTTASQIEEEVTNVWDAITLVGAEAKVIHDPGAETGTWDEHYQRWIEKELDGIDPEAPGTGQELAWLADTLESIRQFPDPRFTARIRNEIEAKLGAHFQFRLGQMNDKSQFTEWASLEEISRSLAFEWLDAASRQAIRDQLSGRIDQFARQGLEALSPDSPAPWLDLYTLVSANGFENFASPEAKTAVETALAEKFTALLKSGPGRLDPGSENMLTAWSGLRTLSKSDWPGKFVPEKTMEDVNRRLGEKLADFLNRETGLLIPSDGAMIVKWREIETLVLPEYLAENDRMQLAGKLKQQFTAYLEKQVAQLAPASPAMIVEWRKLEALVQSDWPARYLPDTDKQLITNLLKEKFTSFTEKRLEELATGDPEFLKKWSETERLVHTGLYGKYMEKGEKAAHELSTKYRQWEKNAGGPVDFSQIEWREVAWTGGEFKHWCIPVHPGITDKGIKPWTWVLIAGVPVTGGLAYWLWGRGESVQANPDALTIACPGQGAIDVLANDTGSEIRLVSITQPQGAAVFDQGQGNLLVTLELAAPLSQIVFSYTIEDKRGRQSTAAVTVSVSLPAISAASDSFEGLAGAPLAANVLTNDNGQGIQVTSHTTPAGGTLSMSPGGAFSFVPATGSCESTSFNYTITDACGQSASADCVLSFADGEPPVIVCPPDTERDCNTSLDTLFTGFPDVSDNCTAWPAVTMEDVYGGEPCQEKVTRTFAATDDQGLSASCVQVILLTDQEAPAIGCPSEIAIPCDVQPDPATTGQPDYSDNCTPNEEIALAYEDEYTGAAMLTRTWTATDHCGLSVSCEQAITLEDQEAPLISCPEQAVISCEVSPDPGATGFPTVSDNCTEAADMPLEYSDQYIGSGCISNILRTWTVADGAGNAASCDQLIVREDLTPPAVICPPDITVTCGQEFDITVTGVATAIDICGGPASASFSDDLSGYSNCEGTILRTWKAADACGNTGSCTQAIVVLPQNCGFEAEATVVPATCSAPGNILLALSGGSGLFFVNVTGPNSFPVPPMPPGVVVIGEFGDLPPGTYVISIVDPEAPPGCELEITVTLPFPPQYTLQVVNVIPPSSPSSADGVIALSVSGGPPMPLNVYVNGFLVGQANNVNFMLTGVPEGTYNIWIVAAGGNGCGSNVVTVVMDAPPGLAGLEIQPMLPGAEAADWPLDQNPGAYIPEHPQLEPSEPAPAIQGLPLGFGVGYGLTGRLQLRWQMGYISGRMPGVWLDPVSGSSYLLERGFRSVTNEGGIRYYCSSGKAAPFIGAGLRWHLLSFSAGRLTGRGAAVFLEESAATHAWSAHLTAGIRWRLGRRAYMELEGSLGSPLGQDGIPEYKFRPIISFRL
jgi:hypothetical protein